VGLIHRAPGFQDKPRGTTEIGFPSGGLAQLAGRQPALRRAEEARDHLHRHSEFLRHFPRRAGPLAAQPKEQANDFFLPRVELPQQPRYLWEIHIVLLARGVRFRGFTVSPARVTSSSPWPFLLNDKTESRPAVSIRVDQTDLLADAKQAVAVWRHVPCRRKRCDIGAYDALTCRKFRAVHPYPMGRRRTGPSQS